ncbi:tenascin-X [Corallococcus sp. EGB]|uniref:tenascin-X n=1 Tax=Corallococcus sp. EGB TaxID=1521117 RepID=UPI001CBE7787|nr:tenascin-X [Corallococcus sp. EGB]
MKARLWMVFASLSLGLLAACGNVDEASLTQSESELGAECPCGGVGPSNCLPCAFICGDGVCDFRHGESSDNCAEDCPPLASCGDGWCNNGETSSTCPQDCGPVIWCGDGSCNGAETSATCPQDCNGPSCGDGLCDFSEMNWCTADCPPPCTGPNCPQQPQNL